MRWLALCCVAAGLGCGETDTPDPTEMRTEDEVMAEMEALSDTSTIPTLEQPNRGELSIAGVGSHVFGGRFSATAYRCDEPRFLSLIVRTDSVDTIFLFHVPEEPPTAAYQVAPSTARLFAEGEVRIGVQLIRGRIGSILRGITGGVELVQAGGRASGDFEATLHEAATEAVTKILGEYREVEIRAADPDECALNASAFVELEPTDSLAGPVAPDSIGTPG